MNDENLMPVRTKKEARERGRNGGLVRSDAKKLAARLRELKKKGLTNENCKKLAEIMESSKLSAFDILVYLESNKSKAVTVADRNKVARSLIDWHKMHHGEKIEIDMQVHHVIDDIDSFFIKKGTVIEGEVVDVTEDNSVTNHE